ncbi:FHA domain-containing protein [Sodalinema gerasimenkoae]|uniref:FHA domain-containing protein n=1 Tax=Sodalinema gerasimenkoae TaxID=2862348 RepID=UPI001358ED84|nr:FHA domain-containing protein [Sodalinema gerasimenkoae]
MIVCPHCNHVNPTGTLECQSCHTPLSADVVTSPSVDSATVLQAPVAKLLHQQSQTQIALPLEFARFRLGKANPRVPPDLDLAGFANAQIVSRVHAEIQQEGQTYYVEDMGSSNGTYINHTLLPQGNRHRLQAGDRIALGKGDLMTFIFQLTELGSD